MIPKPYIARWQDFTPWTSFYQVEQDLIVSRVLVEMFSDEYLCENLAFRGGTALHKLYLKTPVRYSEDIDLVQIKPGPIKPILERIGEIITFFEEKRSTRVSGHGAKIFHRFVSEYESIRLRLKLEINCKEHFNILNLVEIPFSIKNDWFSGSALIKTYDINELLGTKLRALYQRNKGRDLFDLDYSRKFMDLNDDQIINCFNEYMRFSVGRRPTKKEYLLNILKKENDPNFAGDLEGLLRTGIKYNQDLAFDWLKNDLISKMD